MHARKEKTAPASDDLLERLRRLRQQIAEIGASSTQEQARAPEAPSPESVIRPAVAAGHPPATPTQPATPVHSPVAAGEKATPAATSSHVSHAQDATASASEEKAQVPSGAADVADVADAADAARPDERLNTLLSLSSQPSAALTPSERRLALDALGILLPQASPTMRQQLAQRLQIMESPPRALALAALRVLPKEDIAQVLENAHLPDDLLVEIIETADHALLKAIARRPHLNPVVCAALAQHAPSDILGQLLRNERAAITEPVLWKLLERAKNTASLQLLLTERSDLPPPIAFELFWHVASPLRQRLILHQASTSGQMEELLRLAQAPQVENALDFLKRLQMALNTLQEGDREGASRLLAAKMGLQTGTVRRILLDTSGEAFTVLAKCGQLLTHDFGDMLDELAASRLLHVWPFLRERSRLQDFYAAMSVGRARLALLYWDWRSRNAGPYALLPPVKA